MPSILHLDGPQNPWRLEGLKLNMALKAKTAKTLKPKRTSLGSFVPMSWWARCPGREAAAIKSLPKIGDVAYFCPRLVLYIPPVFWVTISQAAINVSCRRSDI